MFKYLSICPVFLLFSIGLAQELTVESQLDSIVTETQANEFVEHNKSLNGKFVVFNKEKHHSKLAKDLFGLGMGGKRVYETEIEKTYYKLIEKNEVEHHRVSYIFLDGHKKSLTEISNLQSDIIAKYKQGIPFENLAKQYSMDNNARRGGDLGWFAIGEMDPDFENQVVNSYHKVGDIFKVNIPSRKWYYVVLKTFDTMMIEERKLLKVVEPISR